MLLYLPLLMLVVGVVLIVLGIRSARGSRRGVVRVVVGALLVGLTGAGYLVRAADSVLDDVRTPAAGRVHPTPTVEIPTERPTPSPVKFTPKPVRDPGKAVRYASCERAFHEAEAARAKVIHLVRRGYANGALSAALAMSRLTVANARCFQDDFVKDARTVKLSDMNRQIPPGIQEVPPGCQQVVTDAYRILGMATGAADATEGDLDLGAGFDALHTRHPECVTDEDVRKLKARLAKELPTGS